MISGVYWGCKMGKLARNGLTLKFVHYLSPPFSLECERLPSRERDLDLLSPERDLRLSFDRERDLSLLRDLRYNHVRLHLRLYFRYIQLDISNLKLVSAFFLSANDSPSKSMKNTSSKKLFAFSRYSNFCNFSLPFKTFQIQKDIGVTQKLHIRFHIMSSHIRFSPIPQKFEYLPP